MQKIILIPDSFKGTMSSREICEIMKDVALRHYPKAEIISVPVADGGEGSVDCFLAALGGKRVTLKVKGPYFEELESFYGVLTNGSAVIEMAACAGLPLVADNRSAEKTTTYGVGQMIAHAVNAGAKKIIVGLGGSATNDGGCGAAAALGIKFYNAGGGLFVPTGETLLQIDRIDFSDLLLNYQNVELITMCDIDNPLCGEQGAAHVFGPQKGASPEQVVRLDQGLAHLAEVLRIATGIDIENLPGAGAAGGMGGGMVAFFGSRLQMGIDTVLDVVRFDELVIGADLVISGEGKIDSQSLSGKAVIGIARRTKLAGVPMIAIVGDIGDDVESIYDQGIVGIFSINRVAATFEILKNRCQEDLEMTVDNLFRYTKMLLKT